MARTERAPSLQTLKVLAILVQNPNDSRYGLELSKAAGLKSGTIYPILARLEQRGWVNSTWEHVDPSEAGRAPRRLYQLTGVGVDAARTALKEALADLSLSDSGPANPGLRIRPA